MRRIIYFFAALLLVQGCTTTSGSGGPISRETRQALAEKDSIGTQAQWRKVQKELKVQGFDPGAVDGLPGPQTRMAIKQFQKIVKLPATGFVTAPFNQRLFQPDSKVVADGKHSKSKPARPIQESSKKPVKSAAVSNNEPLSTENLAGEWAWTEMWETKTFTTRELKRSEPYAYHVFEKTGTSRYRTRKVWRRNSGPTGGVILVARKNRKAFSLQMTSNAAAQRRLFPSTLQPPFILKTESTYSQT